MSEQKIYSFVPQINQAIHELKGSKAVRAIVTQMRAAVEALSEDEQKWARLVYNAMVKQVKHYESREAETPSSSKELVKIVRKWMKAVDSRVEAMITNDRPFDKLWNFYVAFVRAANAMKEDIKEAGMFSFVKDLNYNLHARIIAHKCGTAMKKFNLIDKAPIPTSAIQTPPALSISMTGGNDHFMYDEEYLIQFDREIVDWFNTVKQHMQGHRDVYSRTQFENLAQFAFMPTFEEIFLASHGQFVHGNKLIVGPGDDATLDNLFQNDPNWYNQNQTGWAAAVQEYVTNFQNRWPYVSVLCGLMDTIMTHAIAIRRDPKNYLMFKRIDVMCPRLMKNEGRQYTADILIVDFNIMGYIGRRLLPDPTQQPTDCKEPGSLKELQTVFTYWFRWREPPLHVLECNTTHTF